MKFKKKKNGKPKQIWVPKRKSTESKTKTSTEVRKMCYEKFDERRIWKKKYVQLS